MSNKIPKQKLHCRQNKYRIVGDIVYLTTKNRKPVEFIVDKKDLDKVLEYSWSAHPYRGSGTIIISHRWRETTGKWKQITLSKQLGYSHYTHINRNLFDFRSENMIKNNFGRR